MVKVFTYDTPAGGRSPADIAEDAFAAFNDAPRSEEAAAWPGTTGSGACGHCRSPEGRRVGASHVVRQPRSCCLQIAWLDPSN
jgi:hypothetical protein